MEVSKHLSNYRLGLQYGVPAVLACATGVTVLGQLVGLTKMNTIGLLIRDFQTNYAPAYRQVLPEGSLPIRFAALAGILFTGNLLDPVIEEVAFRWLLQDKILSYFTPKAKKSAAPPIRQEPIKNGSAPFLTKGQLIRIGIVATLFGLAHYGVPGIIASTSRLSAAELGYEARHAALHNLGAGIAYGVIYEKFGLAAAIGAHTVWNYSYDLWRFCDWEITSEKALLEIAAKRNIQIMN